MKTLQLPVQAFFFDIGGLFLSNAWGRESRNTAATLFKLDAKEFEYRHQLYFGIFEIGHISLDEYLQQTVFYTPRSFTPEDFTQFIFSQSQELPMLSWLRAWKPGCGRPVFALNNEGRELNAYRIRKFELSGCFDGFISSCKLGLKKPDPNFYRLAMDLAQVEPSGAVYVDDRPLLVDAASKLGMRAYVHEDLGSTKKMLTELIN